MQPVTINNSQFVSTMWLTQLTLLLLLIVVTTFGVWFDLLWLFVSSVLVTVMLCVYHKIKSQQQHSFVVTKGGEFRVIIENDSAGRQVETVRIKSIWQIPQILFLQIIYQQKMWYISVFRPVLGAVQFSHLVVALTQLESKK